MDTQATGTVVLSRSLGKLPETNVTYSELNNVAPLTGHRVSYQRFKSKEQKDGTFAKRENMAVQVAVLDCDAFTSVSEHKFLNDILAEYQDSVVARCANGNAEFIMVMDQTAMIADYNDTSRDSNGRKVTKENIGEWFMDNAALYVAKAALEKNAQMTEETVSRVVKGYSEMFQKLTAYNLTMIFTEPQFILVKRILANVANDSSEIRTWIDAKIAKIESAVNAETALVDAI